MDKRPTFEMLIEMSITRLVSDAMKALREGDDKMFQSCVSNLKDYTGIPEERLSAALKGENDEKS